MFLFRKRQQVRSTISSIEEKQNLLTIEKEIKVYVGSESEDISKKICQKLMVAKNK